MLATLLQRVGYATLSAVLLALAVSAFALAVNLLGHCGRPNAYLFTALEMFLLVPLSVVFGVLVSVMNERGRRKLFAFEGALLAIAMIAVGVMEVIPRHDFSPDRPPCAWTDF